MKGQLALITGATSGIGEAMAVQLARLGTDLIVTGRRSAKLEALKQRLESECAVRITPLVFDVSNRTECERAISSLGEASERVDILINNAGLAKGVEKLQDSEMSDWDVMIDTNIKGLLYMTRLITPAMIKRGRGHIVNIGSVAGRWVYPGGAVYCASKFAVRAISDALRLDIAGTGIRVTNIEPGMVESEFSLVRFGDQSKAKAVYAGMEPLSPTDIAETVTWCLSRPAHVNIQELVIFPTDQAAVGVVHRGKEKRS